MSDDLSEFLRQAALRREARKRNSGQASPPATSGVTNPPPRPVPVLRESRPMESIEPLSPDQPRIVTHLPPDGHLRGTVAEADARREAHLREVFGDNPSPLAKPAKGKGKKKGGGERAKTLEPSPPPVPEKLPEPAPPATPVRSTSDLLQLLRDPQSLRTAFIAAEIFGRKFQ